MTEFRKAIFDKLKENRPNLKVNSLGSYVATLFNLIPKINGKINNDNDIKIEWFENNIEDIKKYVTDVSPNKRKSILSAVFIITNNDDVRKLMIEDINVVNEHYKTQTKSKTEKLNWIDWNEVLELYNNMSLECDLIFKKKVLTKTELMKLNAYVLLSCFVLIPPRRVLDYSEMKIRNYNKEDDNYMKKNEAVFNIYKTSDKYGKVNISLPLSFQQIIKQWIKINESDYLIINSKGLKNSSTQITKMLNKIFGKKVSCDILRHSYLSELYGDIPQMIDMENTAKQMGHSVLMSLKYVKK